MVISTRYDYISVSGTEYLKGATNKEFLTEYRVLSLMTSDIIELFEEKNAYATLLAIYELKRPDKSTIYNHVTGRSHHIKSIDQRIETFEQHGLVETEKEKAVPPHTWVWLTPKGQDIARKISPVFDETKEVFSMNKEQVAKLAKACTFDEIKAQGIETWQDFVKKAVEEKYAKFEIGKLW